MNILRLAIKQHEHYTIQCCYFKLHCENYCYFSKRHIVYFTTELCVRLQLMILLNLRDLATIKCASTDDYLKHLACISFAHSLVEC